MKQVLQRLDNGQTEVTEVPAPSVSPGHVFIRSRRSLISAGTERMLVEFGKGSLVAKARQQPEKVRMVLEKVRTDGISSTLEAVRGKLSEPVPLGYCNVGIVEELGGDDAPFQVGQRVVSNGYHAEFVSVPYNLCAAVPDEVPDDEAVFAVLGAIALQGIRLVQPTLGEAVVVSGLGLIGLLTVQLLRSSGCRVLGLDFNPERLQLAESLGAEVYDLSKGEGLYSMASRFSRGRGVDAVLVTASTKSSEPISQAARMSRKRGRIVLVGVSGLELSRQDFYEKELTFQVSCSYGPGRYDPMYEQKGQDYPFGFVRWTEQRNFEAVLDMMASRHLDVRPLISHKFPIDQAESAYKLVAEPSGSLGLVLEYPEIEGAKAKPQRVVSLKGTDRPRAPGEPVIGIIGAGNYATRVLIPAFQDRRASIAAIVSKAGISGTTAASKFGIVKASTDASAVIEDPEINTIVIATRHDSHARYVVQALKAGKHVFVEKPLALQHSEIDQIEDVYWSVSQEDKTPILTVGFNRRYSPLVIKMKQLIDQRNEPACLVATINAGPVASDHWVHDRDIGGGRILGEGCHFIDLMRHLVGAPVTNITGTTVGKTDGLAITEDKCTLVLNFSDGSIGTLHYFANGHRSFPKERLEVFCSGGVLVLDNFFKLAGYGWPGFKQTKLRRQDKGQSGLTGDFLKAVSNGQQAPIPVEELFEVSRISIRAADLARGT